MLQLPIHPRLGRLLIAAADNGMSGEGAGAGGVADGGFFGGPAGAAKVHGLSDLLMQSELNAQPSSRLP